MSVLLSLSLWFALTMSWCGDAGGLEEESTTAEYDYTTWTAGYEYEYDYDYNVTFEYESVHGAFPSDVRSKASGIGGLSLVLLLGLAVHQIRN